ncbi:unnamed protein product, partial [Darwinula stevensoni]
GQANQESHCEAEVCPNASKGTSRRDTEAEEEEAPKEKSRNWEAAKLTEIWEHSKLAKKLLDAKKREAMNDFDRFKLARAKQIRNRIVRQRFVPMLRKARREGTLKPKKRKHQKKRKIIGAPKA